VTYRTRHAAALAVALLTAASYSYADTKISALPAASSQSGAEVIPEVQSGATVGATVSQLNTYVNANLTGNTSGTAAGLSAILSPTFGGLGVANPTAHGVLLGEGPSAATPLVLGADTVLRGTSAADPVAAAVPSCSAGASALTYNTTTHAFGCNTISSGVSSVALTMPTGLTVSGSPVTTSGTLAVTTTLSGSVYGTGSGFSAVALGADTFLQGTATTPQAGSLILCGDSTHALGYDTTAHTFTCNSISGTGGTVVSGTFTATITAGCTTTPSFTWSYQVGGGIAAIGNLGVLSTCTSNSTSLTIGGIPAAAIPAHVRDVACTDLEDNSGGGKMGTCEITTSGNIAITLLQAGSNTTGAFTSSGTKGVNGFFTITYPVN
jgi:hypothetical protein